ncbi:MAG: hypothetical protein JNM70_16365 [Anaerolineae bacterium]|nr:hypothetical protein [Anaerolineae bacterium]
MKRDSIPRQVLDRVDEELLGGEEVLWIGRPSGMGAGLSAPLNIIVLMLLVVGFLVGIFTGLEATPMICLVLLGILAPVALLIIPQQMRGPWSSRSTVYAVTDRRALIIRADRVQSYGPRDIQFIERRMRRNGRGDILFAREARATGSYYGARPDLMSVGFFGIEDPRAVEALMLEVFRPVEVHSTDKPKHDAAPSEDDAPLDSEPRRSQRQ